MAEAITLIRALSGGGRPGDLRRRVLPCIRTGPGRGARPAGLHRLRLPKSLAVTGQLADGWIAPGGSDWLSQLYRESRPRVDAAAAAAAGSRKIIDVYNFGGRITPEPLAATRGEDGRWIGGSVQQWVDELTAAVLDHHAAGFITAPPTTPPPTRPWLAGPPRSSPPSAKPSPASARPSSSRRPRGIATEELQPRCATVTATPAVREAMPVLLRGRSW